MRFCVCVFADLSEALDDDADPTQSAITAVAALAAAWPQLHQGKACDTLLQPVKSYLRETTL